MFNQQPLTRKEQLERSLIYTPRDDEELENAKDNLEYCRKVGDTQYIPIYLQQIIQGNEYLGILQDEENCNG